MKQNTSGIVIPHPAFIKARKKTSGSGSAGQIEKPATTAKSKSAKARKPRKLPALQADRHFWPNVDTSAGPEACHPWTGHIDHGNGYGRIWGVEGLPYAHRTAWSQSKGRKVPRGHHVTHSCNNKPCCNPEHLICRRPKGNSQDAVKDGLMKGRKFFKKDQLDEIIHLRFARGWTYTAIAKKFDAGNRTIADICKGRTYAKETGILNVGSSRKLVYRQSASVPTLEAASRAE